MVLWRDGEGSRWLLTGPEDSEGKKEQRERDGKVENGGVESFGEWIV